MNIYKYLILILLILATAGCKFQKQNDKESPQIRNSGELIFGDKKVTYFIEGEGIPCFICADGEWQKKCFSKSLKNHFQFVFIEQRLSNVYDGPRDYSKITMDTIVKDLDILREHLGYNKIYVLGHSIAGLIALEYARKFPDKTMGVIMINTPPHFNPGYMDIIWANWEEKASAERKEIYEDNQQSLQKINRDSISAEEWNYLSYKARVPMDWYDPEYDVSELYPQFRINNEGWNHFYSLMRDYDITRSQIETPIFLSLAKHDYIMPEFIWEDYQDKIEKLTIFRFEKSGHYPHVEEQELFDSQLLSWIEEN